MWPFRRKADASAEGDATAPPQLHFDWKGLPAVQRTVSQHPLTIPTQRFAAELATGDDPRTLAHPLGHRLSLEAPPGIALGIAQPVPRSGGPQLVTATHRVRNASVQRAAEPAAADDVEADETAEIAGEPTVSSLPLRHLPVASEPRPAVQLTRVSADNQPRPLPTTIQRMEAHEEPAGEAAAAEPAAEAPALPSFPRLTIGQARRLGLGAPMRSLPETAANVQRSAEAQLPAVPAPSQPAPQSEEAPQFTPFILDFLVNKRSEVVAPSPISRPQRIPRPLTVSRTATPESESTAVQSAAEPNDGSPEAPASSSAAPSAAETVAPEPTAPALGEVAEIMPSAPAIQRSAELGAAPEEVQQTDPGSEPAGVPVIQRTSADSGTVSPSFQMGDDDLAQDREAEQSLPTVGGVRKLTSFTADVMSDAPLVSASAPVKAVDWRAAGIDHVARPLAIQRTTEPASSTSAADKPASSRPLQLLATATPAIAAQDRSSRPVSVQRQALASSETMPLLSNRAPLGATAVSATAVSAARGTVPETSLDPMPAQALPLALPRSSSPAFPVPVQRMSAAATSAFESHAGGSPSYEPGSTPLVMRYEAPVAPQPVQPLPVQAQVEAAPAAVAEAPHAAAGHESADEETRMEDLAGKLYDKIRVRLRNELLVDRERAGFLTDLR